MACVQTTLPLTLLLDNTDLKRQVDSHDQTSALADQQDTGHLQEQVSDLEYEKVHLVLIATRALRNMQDIATFLRKPQHGREGLGGHHGL